jgi:hypothetical protein
MAVAAPALALAGIALLALTAVAYPARAQDRCAPRLPQLASADGKTFNASAYGRTAWMQRMSGGKRLPYAIHVWKGDSGGRVAYLIFDEIPGTSGPNYHLDYRLKKVVAKIEWKPREPALPSIRGSSSMMARCAANGTSPIARRGDAA